MSAAFGTSQREPMRRLGIEPFLTAAYALPRESPNKRPASGAVKTRFCVSTAPSSVHEPLDLKPHQLYAGVAL